MEKIMTIVNIIKIDNSFTIQKTFINQNLFGP